MIFVRRSLGLAAALAVLLGAQSQYASAETGVRIWGPGQYPAGRVSSLRIWTAPALSKAEVPAGVDDEDPAEANATEKPLAAAVPDTALQPKEYSVTTVSPTLRHYRLRRALGQRFLGFKKQYRGQRYAGFARLSRIRKYKVRNSKVFVDSARRHILVINRRPVTSGF